MSTSASDGASGGDPAEPANESSGKTDRRLIEFLVCPVTKGPLVLDTTRHELVSKRANLAYPIRSGVPLLTVDSARPLDGD